jgi:hypothetical protein
MTELFQAMTTDKLTPAKRLEFVERDVRDHAKTLTSLTEMQARLAGRMEGLDKADLDQLVTRARREERDTALNERLTRIEADIKSIKGVFNWLLGIIGASILGAFALFIIKGGLNI